jgi:UPF0755 protein
MKKETLREKKIYLIPATLCLAGMIGLFYYYFFTGFTHHTETEYVFIDDNDNIDSVYNKLSPIGSRHGMTALSTLLRHSGYEQKIHTGRYIINPDDGVIGIFRRLRNGQQSPVRLTIPESRTIYLLASALGKRLMLDSVTIACTLTDSSYCARFGYTPQTIPALFVPNTYEVYWDTHIDPFMERMKREHERFWNFDRLSKAQALGLTPIEVCTLASIIDEETANTQEKPMIAGMYLNRLHVGMPLQADPTVKYALGDFAIRRIRHGMLDIDSPYNTYKYEGLPPGPIKVASIKGIDAVLNRVSHDYLFMCAKEDFSGTHNFASTYREHQQNAARYAKALNKRGIE